ncbi:tRNA pseudouridine13 synthase [Nematocida ausubeli]|nr:tRNA pseudouridine13 synthase [Nematocida ausubeli]
MKDFNWSTCLNKGKSTPVILKKEESDFIVREGVSGRLLNIGDNSIERMKVLDQLPGITERLLSSMDLLKRRKASVLCRITEIESKEDRREIHKIYCMHPFIHTKSLSTSNGSTDILVIFDTHHRMHTFSGALTKKGKTTHDAVEVLARLLKIPSHQINFAGNKDKKAITTQRISISGISYLDIQRVVKMIAQEDSKQDNIIDGKPEGNNLGNQNESTEPIEETEVQGAEQENISGKNSKLFTGANREVKETDLEDEGNIKILKATDIMAEIERVAREFEDIRAPEQTDSEYLEKAKNMKDGIILTDIERVQGGIQLGDLDKNRFYLRLEATHGLEGIEERITILKTEGFPNYYGNQRFGYGMSNPLVGEAMIQRDFKKAADLILKNLECLENSQRVKSALEHINKQEYSQAAEILPGKFQTEKIILRSLEKKIPPKIIFSRIRRENRMMYYHSYQSKIFNDTLEQRLIQGVRPQEYTTDETIGSITAKNDIQDLVKVSENPSIKDILIPLYPTEEVGEKKSERVPDLKGGFRKGIIIPGNLCYSIEGNILSLSFELPPGTYATMVVKELSCNEVIEVTW